MSDGGGVVAAVPNMMRDRYHHPSDYHTPEPSPLLLKTVPEKSESSEHSSSRKSPWQEAWERYNEFEEYSYYDKSLSPAQFTREWERRLGLAAAVGCEYTDRVLAFKLLARCHLRDTAVSDILRRLGSAVEQNSSRGDILGLMRSLIINFGEQHLAAMTTNGGNSGGGENNEVGDEEEEDEEDDSGGGGDNESGEPDDDSNGGGDDDDNEDEDDEDYEAMAENFKQEMKEEDSDDDSNSKEEEEDVRVKAEHLDDEEEQQHDDVDPGGLQQLLPQQQLRSHQQLYPCDLCGKAFKTKNYLKDHRVLHTNARPHKCDRCSEAFNFKSNLRHHKATTHPESEEAAAAAAADGRSNVRRRGRKRRPPRCTSCHAEFASRAALKRHCDKEHDGDGVAETSMDSAVAAITTLAEMACCFCGSSNFESPLSLQVAYMRI
jgi:hypothetical protein